jgi:hypothetical protein
MEATALHHFQPIDEATAGQAERLGLRFGDRGAHTSRTLMLTELQSVLAAVSADGTRADYAHAIVDENCTNKRTLSTRRLTNQRLGELYGLDVGIPVFRVMRHLWERDQAGRPLLALLCGIARDPLLAATAGPIIGLPVNSEFPRAVVTEALREVVGERLNDNILGKVVRNAASSWAQAGHFEGRTFKFRRHVAATAPAVAYALYLAHAVGIRGEALLQAPWVMVLDCSASRALELALEAKRMGLIDLRTAAGVFQVSFDRMDPWAQRR